MGQGLSRKQMIHSESINNPQRNSLLRCNSDVWGQMVASLNGEHSIMCKLVKSVCCAPETYIILCVNYSDKKKGRDLLTVCRQG